MRHDKSILALVEKIQERCRHGDPEPGTMPSRVVRDREEALAAVAAMADSIGALVKNDTCDT